MSDERWPEFTWIIEHELAACRYPAGDAAYRRLRAAGIALLVNLHADAHAPDALDRYGLREVHLPVIDFMAPTLAQVERGVHAIQSALDGGERVAVHCAYGLGRAGAMAACYLVSVGLDADGAIARVRTLRPGSIETLAQVNVIREFAQQLRG